MTVDLNMVYDDHQYSNSVRQDNATHGAARPHRRLRALQGHRWVARVPLHPAQIGLVQPPHRHLARLLVSCIPKDGCLGSIPFVRHNLPFGGLTTPGEMFGLAIYFGTCWQLGCDILYCFLELCAGVLCRAYAERRRSPVVYIVLRHGQGSLQICCAGGPAC